MAKQKPNLDNYVEVNERIDKFFEIYPEGSLQSRYIWDAADLVICVGYAYRTPNDPRPGMGHASEPYPGKTPYTKDSELMNAETSAWGRALAALGFEVKRAIASREEVRNRTEVPEERELQETAVGPAVGNVQSTDNGPDEKGAARALAAAAQETYRQLVEEKGANEAKQMVRLKLSELGVEKLEDMTEAQAKDFRDYLQGLLPTQS